MAQAFSLRLTPEILFQPHPSKSECVGGASSFVTNPNERGLPRAADPLGPLPDAVTLPREPTQVMVYSSKGAEHCSLRFRTGYQY